MNNAFKPADILVPKKSVDMNNWSVIACDNIPVNLNTGNKPVK